MASSEPQRPSLPAGLTARPLAADDIPQALRLSEEAGWNQVAADWRIFVELGSATGLRREDGRLVATAATLPYDGGFGWISMVLVTAEHRRQGLATWLLCHAMDALLAHGRVPVLDATPAGRTVYLGLGFRDSWRMRRLVARRDPAAGATAAPDLVVRPIQESDWPALLDLDRRVFGAGRRLLLRQLAARLPEAALAAEKDGRLQGFLLGRDGRVMTQLGPLAAEDEAMAQALLARAMAKLAAPFAIDLPDRHAGLGAWLQSLGFAAERPLIRMVHGRDAAFDDTARLFAIAGPELG